MNSQVAREIRVELVRSFCQEQFVERGMVADIALHAPGTAGDERNHAHILLTTRRIGSDGFTTEDRDWNKTETLEGWRESWSRETNAALERAGREERVDHRTLERSATKCWSEPPQRGSAATRARSWNRRGEPSRSTGRPSRRSLPAPGR